MKTKDGVKWTPGMTTHVVEHSRWGGSVHVFSVRLSTSDYSPAGLERELLGHYADFDKAKAAAREMCDQLISQLESCKKKLK